MIAGLTINGVSYDWVFHLLAAGAVGLHVGYFLGLYVGATKGPNL